MISIFTNKESEFEAINNAKQIQKTPTRANWPSINVKWVETLDGDQIVEIFRGDNCD